MSGPPLRYLALGDSYTIGEGVAPDERWPHRLAAHLRTDGILLGDPETVAVTGWTTDELAEGIEAVDPQGPFDLVTLLVGVNNQYRGGALDTYRAELRDLLASAVAFAGGRPGRVVVVSIPDWGVTPFAAKDERGRSPERIAEEIDAFNAVAREEAELVGAHFVDITPLSGTQGALVVEDELHPSGTAYKAWTEHILPAARAALGAER